MMRYYLDYLRTAYRRNIFDERVREGLKEKDVKLDIFYEMAGDGLFSYQKAINSLDDFKAVGGFTSPRLLYELGVDCFEMANLLPVKENLLIRNYLIRSEDNFNELKKLDENYRKSDVADYLDKLEKLKNQYNNDGGSAP